MKIDVRDMESDKNEEVEAEKEEYDKEKRNMP
jgi:hypothetical protein